MKKALALTLMLGVILGFCGAANALELTDGTTKYGTAKTLDAGSNVSFSESAGEHTINVTTFDGVIGGTTPAAGTFTTLASTGTTTVGDAPADAVHFNANTITFEGATADANELTLVVPDVASDLNYTIPLTTVSSAGVISTLVTNTVDAANSMWFASNALVMEGATADAFELTIQPADVGADLTITLPASSAAVAPFYTALTTNSVDAANAVTGTSNGFIAEGATADGFETALSFTDPTADQTVTVPNATGTVALHKVTTTTLTPDTTATITVVPGVDVFYTYTIDTDNEDCTLTFSGGGTAGDRATIMFITDAGGSADEVMTFAGANSTGTLTLANAASDRYVVEFISDGTIYNEVSRTAIQVTA